jgi:LCP family protein required for cell wall assembly
VRTGASAHGFAHTAGYALTCVFSALVLAVSGFSYFLVRDVSSIGSSHAISGGPSIGAQNILLMGLESRRDWNGNILPANILKALHAGSAQGVADGVGGNDTNTLILLHIPAGGKKAVGFSIPRDDWVNFAGTVGSQQQGKIDQAYGVSMYYEQQQVKAQNPGISQNQLAFEGNEAGRKAAVDTVEQLTGVHIDHFAEVNLDGFYELANVLNGVEVCLNHPVKDANSGADFPAGYQHLNASQALAFVRQRDGLPNGDLDRTHRQQAFLDAVMEQLRTEGVIGDLTRIQALLSVAKQYVITDADWNLLDFESQMQDLTSGNLVFHTLPIQGYATIDGQDANVVNPASIENIVQSTFYPKPAPPSAPRTQQPGTAAAATTVDVLNGGGAAGLAARVSSAIVAAGYEAGEVGNGTPRTTTEILYGTGEAANASHIASAFGATSAASATVAANHIEVLIGADTSTVPTFAAPTASPSSAPSASPSSVIPTTGPQGGAVGAEKGIPCVN